jgi:hypothetical protein
MRSFAQNFTAINANTVEQSQTITQKISVAQLNRECTMLTNRAQVTCGELANAQTAVASYMASQSVQVNPSLNITTNNPS